MISYSVYPKINGPIPIILAENTMDAGRIADENWYNEWEYLSAEGIKKDEAGEWCISRDGWLEKSKYM